MAEFWFGVLGPLEAARDGRGIILGGPKPRAVLARLLLEADQPVRVAAIVDAVWGDNPPPTAGKTLQKYISILRTALGEPGLLVTRGDRYALAVRREQIDSGRFERLLDDAARVREPTRAASLLEQALGFWRGEPFAELMDDPAAEAERVRLRERRLAAVEVLNDTHLSLGRHTQLAGQLEQQVATHPLRERLWSQLMLAHYRSGRQADALEAYHRLRRVLDDQLAIQPSLPVRQLYEAILAQDPALDAPERVLAARRTPTNLQVQLSSFIGRRAELAELRDLVTRHRLVTLTGPAGSGKTRLAVELAGQLRGQYPDGVWLAELAALTQPDQVSASVTAALGLPEEPGRTHRQVLGSYVRDKQLLLVLDNCEHVVGESAVLTSELLGTAETLAVVATSREPLDVPGELIYEVQPLPVPPADANDVEQYDAVRLLVERARSTNQRFSLTTENARAVARISRQLDGIPLALELAAARLRAFDPDKLATLLDDRFDVLESARHSVPPRHRTLRAAVDWSHGLLTPAEQVLFHRLAVFAGGFDLEAAEQVCGVEPLLPHNVLTLLPALVGRSLVTAERTPQGGTRYRLLETLREYASDRLGELETEAMRRRHATYFLDQAEQLAAARGAELERWLAALARDQDNLRAALHWSFVNDHELGVRLAIALETYWEGVAQRAEGQQWLSLALEIAGRVPPTLRIATYVAASNLLHTSDMARSTELAERGLAQARERADEWWTARALLQVADSYTRVGRHDEAIPLFEEALGTFRRRGDRWHEALSLEGLGEALSLSRPDAAITQYGNALALFRELNELRYVANVLCMMATDRIHAGRDLDQAEAWLKESLTIGERLGSIHDIAHARSRLGQLAYRRGQLDVAREHLHSCLPTLRKIGDRRCTARVLGTLGRMAAASGSNARAVELLTECLSLARGVGLPRVVVDSVDGLAELAATSGDRASAALLFTAADHLCTSMGLAMPTHTTRRRDEQLGRLQDVISVDALQNARQLATSMTRDELIDWTLARSAQWSETGS